MPLTPSSIRTHLRLAGLLVIVGAAVASFYRGTLVGTTEAAAPAPVQRAADGILRVPQEYATIRAAVEAALPGDTILVSAGTYAERIDLGAKALTLRGVEGAAATAIVGDGTEGALVSVRSLPSRLEGLTLRGARAGCGLLLEGTDSEVSRCSFESNDEGGAVVRGGQPFFVGCTFRENRSSFAGGGVRSEDAYPTFADCTFSGNEAVTFGGGLYARGGAPVLVAARLESNRTTSGAYGGGLYGEGASFEVYGTTLADNESDLEGGGAYLVGGETAFHGCRFEGNLSLEARSVSADGGQVRLVDTTLCGRAEENTRGFVEGGEFSTACLADCDGDGLADAVQIARGWAEDCNANAIPDSCELELGVEFDDDGDGRLDSCESRERGDPSESR